MGINSNSIINNMLAMNGNRQLGIVTNRKAKITEKLASGYKINRSADDAAGLAISEKMRRQIRGLTQASQNMQDGVSLCQVADGWLTEVHDMMQRINELAVQGSNGTLNDEDRGYIDKEVQALKDDIERIFDTANFNEIPLFHQPYTPTIIPQPEVEGFAVFHTGTNEAPGGLEINHIRYNIKELQNLGMGIDDDGVALSDIENFEFKTTDGEIVNLDLSKGDSLDNVVRNYEWKAKDDGIYVNDIRAIQWSDLTYNGVQGLSDTTHFEPGTYSFTHKGMEISFSIVDREADKEKVMYSINGDEITRPVSWNVSAGSATSLAVAPIGGNVVDKITSSNKNDIADTYKLSATAEGLAIYNETDDAYSNRIAWKDIPQIKAGSSSITDWGKAVNSNTEVTFDKYSTFRFKQKYNDVEFDFQFNLAEVSSLEEAIRTLDGKNLSGNLVSPGSLSVVSGSVPSGSVVQISNANINNDFSIQKAYGRDFSSTDNSTDTLNGKVYWTKTVLEAESEAAPGTGSSIYSRVSNISRTLTSSTPGSNTETWYISKDVEVDDGNGNTTTVRKYYEVEKSYRTDIYESVDKYRMTLSEKSRLDRNVSLGNKNKFADPQTVTLNFYRENTYKHDDRVSVSIYTLKDPEGKTREELGMTPAETLHQTIANNIFTYDAQGKDYTTSSTSTENWQLINKGDRVLTNNSSSYSKNIYMDNNAFTLSHTITAYTLLNMSNNVPQSSDLLFKATGNAQRTLGPDQTSIMTNELDFNKIRLNVPKKRLDIQSGTEAGQIIRMEWSALNLTIAGIAGTNTRTQNASQNAISQVKDAMEIISENRILFGAYQNRMEHAIRMTDNVVENTTAAESQIRDTDMSKAMMELAKDNILEQAGQTILAQANQSKQGILSLLQ